jgi:lysozyme
MRLKTRDLSAAVAFIKKFEGLKLDAYLDSAGKPTIGYGTIQYRDGTWVKLGDHITETSAELILLDYLKSEVDKDLQRLLGSWYETCPINLLIALASFLYNLGYSKIGPGLKSSIQSRDLPSIATQMKRYCLAGGKIIPGLRNRREAEVSIFL